MSACLVLSALRSIVSVRALTCEAATLQGIRNRLSRLVKLFEAGRDFYRWISGVVVAVLMLGIEGVGCGGGSDERNSSATKAEFVKQAALICADARGSDLRRPSRNSTKQRQAGFDVVGGAAFKALEAELAELGEEVLQEKMIPSMKSQVKQLEGLDGRRRTTRKSPKVAAQHGQAIGEVEEQGLKGLMEASKPAHSTQKPKATACSAKSPSPRVRLAGWPGDLYMLRSRWT